MNIAALGSVQTAHPIVASAAAAASAPGGFGAQVQAWMANHSSASDGATQSASMTEPGRATRSTERHHPHESSSTEANATSGTSANLSGSASSGSAAGTGSNPGTGASTGTGQRGPGGLLLDDMMRGLQAYGTTSAFA